MKTQNAKPVRSRASVLIVVLSVVAVSAIALASYLTLVQGQAASVARSQSWNYIIPVAEAGIEDGLAMVNDGAPQIIINQWAWTNKTSSDGWSGPSNNKWTRTYYVSGSNYYTATIDISSGSPVVTSVGVVPYTSLPWKFSALGQPMMAAVGSQQSVVSTANLGRKIQALTVLNPLFNAAIVTRSNLNLNGNNVTVDSFDSSSFLYSTAGQWDVLKHLANGDVATDSSIVGDISLGNGNIYGHVYTGPGTAESAVQIGPNGLVGATTWTKGIETGYWSGDFNLSVPDVIAPATGTTTLPAATNGVVTLNGGNYTISTSDPNIAKPLIVTAPTLVWVQGSYTPPLITIINTNTTNGSLTLYVGRTSGSGDSLSLGGNGTINQPGFAQNFQIYGLPSLTSISLSGNAGMIATVYAPEANASFSGGGNNETDVSGSLVVNSLTMNGHFNVHYDQNLKVNGPSRGWVPNAWTEMKYP